MISKSILLVVIGFLSFTPVLVKAVLVKADIGYGDGKTHYITTTIVMLQTELDIS